MYIGGTARHLLERIGECRSTWLSDGTLESFNSAKVSHLAQTNQTVSVSQAFRVVYKFRCQHSKLAKCCV